MTNEALFPVVGVEEGSYVGWKLPEPERVLFEFDAFIFSFVFRSERDDPELAWILDADDDVDRYLLILTTDAALADLESGKTPMRDFIEAAVDPMLVDVGHDGFVRRAWTVRVADLPEDVLPRAGITLYPRDDE